ncbi:SDR family NAD(P)-dependent oxidoreductase [Xenorhabdus bovienii]|uniref:Carbonyl reductase family member 4 n=3 Tax=Xenorhabdus bovienii TaxID=40576 RepID=A0A077PDY1_XENBV|nr:SDR family NAD(P)-dependent oxidoreductase [Xenorhabdus bovienii]MDE1480365.1 SDR family oxidoreductase [Xenorhabdus bovienii]MDE1482512.1 SDR family oxidoreductase [Xenorhabdus bovienii]MDE1485078.1 SDR family oxidoreductase [Xenorhabdus bovienii]MDE1491687.1 SDR family oxidoreductase [Xenorhabdus bovienii]MDE1496188.1 SDR family oxidoreductase [Xenorhabdus bovienii]
MSGNVESTSEAFKKCAIVTGGSKGIGRAIVLSLLDRGYRVAFCYRNETPQTADFIAEVTQNYPDVLPIRVDLAKAEDVSTFINTVIEAFGRIDLLVNNVGVTRDGLLATMETKDIELLINNNLLSYILCSREVLKVMIPQRSGLIINISSISATRPNKGQSIYAATKGGIESLTRALAVEVAPKKIRVNAVAPGIIQTEMTESLLKTHKELINNKVLLKRVGNVSEITSAVHFLIENNYMTGEVINVNGGLSLS